VHITLFLCASYFKLILRIDDKSIEFTILFTSSDCNYTENAFTRLVSVSMKCQMHSPMCWHQRTWWLQ